MDAQHTRIVRHATRAALAWNLLHRGTRNGARNWLVLSEPALQVFHCDPQLVPGRTRRQTTTEEMPMLIRNVMTEHVMTVRPDASIFEVARLMRDEDIGAVPVADDDRLIGMVTDRDIVVRALADGQLVQHADAQSVMSQRMLYCFADQEVEEVLENMGEMQVRRMPVVDRYKRLVGMVSIGDLCGKASLSKAGDSLNRISWPASH